MFGFQDLNCLSEVHDQRVIISSQINNLFTESKMLFYTYNPNKIFIKVYWLPFLLMIIIYF